MVAFSVYKVRSLDGETRLLRDCVIGDVLNEHYHGKTPKKRPPFRHNYIKQNKSEENVQYMSWIHAFYEPH